MIDYRNYSGFSDLAKIEEKMHNIVSLINWRKIKNELLLMPKDDANSLMWWYVVQGKDYQYFYESNVESITDSSDCLLTEESEYLQISLSVGCIPGLEEIKEFMINLPGVEYAGMHFLSVNSYSETHTDKNTINVLFHVKTSSGGKLIVDDKEFTFQDRQVFAFDGDSPHSVENKFGNDWIMFVLRISKNSFY